MVRMGETSAAGWRWSEYVIEPGHDAWVVGGEGFVAFEFEQHAAETFARG